MRHKSSVHRAGGVNVVVNATDILLEVLFEVYNEN